MRLTTQLIHSLRRPRLLALVTVPTLISGNAWAQETDRAETDGSRNTDSSRDNDNDGVMVQRLDDRSEARPEPAGGIDVQGDLEDPPVLKSAGRAARWLTRSVDSSTSELSMAQSVAGSSLAAPPRSESWTL
jgi:hypothetical protein